MRCDRSQKLQVIAIKQATVIAHKPTQLQVSPTKLIDRHQPRQRRASEGGSGQFSFSHLLVKLLLLSSTCSFIHGRLIAAVLGQSALSGPGNGATGRPLDAEPFQLIGQVGNQVRLPCLVGKKANCGEPYFVAWYRLNATSRSWTRIEYRSDEDDELDASSQRPSRRFHFTWPGEAKSGGNSQSTVCNQAGERLTFAGANQNRPELNCAHLSVSSLEPADEGQYISM